MSKQYIRNFIEAVYPDAPDLALCSSSERECLEAATALILDLRKRVSESDNQGKKHAERWSIDHIISEILEELSRAKRIHPGWPIDPVHAASLLIEEAGELQKAANEFTYQDKTAAAMANEAIQTGAMVIRFLQNYPHYRQLKGAQRDDND